jgi:cell division protein FtsQ
MKKWLKISFIILFLIALGAIIFFVNQEENQQILSKPEIFIQVQGESAFLTKNELQTRLERSGLLPKGLKTQDLDPNKVEKFILKMSEVKSVKVYKKIGKEWNIDVVLRIPIARVFNSFGETYYLDSEGCKIGTSNFHTARVLVFNGNILDRLNTENVTQIINNNHLKSIRKLDDMYRISNYVCKDPLFQSMIGQVFVNEQNEFVFVPLIGDQIIEFGTANSDEEVQDKFKKLKVFYEQAMPFEGWNKYSVITIKYNGQIVCKKKQV